ncbi:MAG: MFS transporter [Kurthia sp.]|nr:MFS transporter [Candidatus Kurthia equi]
MEAQSEVKRARQVVLILLFLGWALGNLDRYLINYAIVYIGHDLTLTSSETGIVLSAFFLGYAIMQMPGGLLADKFGAKKVLLIAVLSWSIFTGLTAVAWSLVAIVVIRFLFGIGEGGFQPSASKIIATVFPSDERSKAMSVLLSSGAIMAMIVPIISAWLLVSIGWRWFFVIAGLIGLLITFLYWKYIKLPNEEAEEDTIEEVQASEPTSTSASETVSASEAKEENVEHTGILMTIFKMPIMWTLLVAYFTIYAVNWGLNSWLPTYLTDIRSLDIISIGWLQLIPGFAMVIGMLVSGYIIDKLTLKTNKIVGAGCATLLALFLFLMFNADSMPMFIAYQSIISLLMTYVTLLLPSFILKLIPAKVTGTAMGMANTGGQLAGFVTPMLIGFMIDAFDGSYNAAVWILVVLAAICIVAILLTQTKTGEGESEYETI